MVVKCLHSWLQSRNWSLVEAARFAGARPRRISARLRNCSAAGLPSTPPHFRLLPTDSIRLAEAGQDIDSSVRDDPVQRDMTWPLFRQACPADEGRALRSLLLGDTGKAERGELIASGLVELGVCRRAERGGTVRHRHAG